MKRKNPKLALGGYALPTVLAMTALLASASAIMFATMRTSIEATATAVKRRNAFYVCDGLGRSVTRLANNYLTTTSTPNASEMEASVCTDGGGCNTGSMLPNLTPGGYEIVEFSIAPIGVSEANTPLPSGPFKGMNAKIDNVRFDIRAQSPEGYECQTAQEVSLGQISIFQFYVFSDTFFDSHPGPLMTLDGRVHVNNNACLGGNMRLSRITASGKVLQLQGAECEDYGGYGGPGDVRILNAGGSYQSLLDSNDHNSNADWEAFSLTRWGGNVLDAAHDVPILRPPTLAPPTAQSGRNGDGSVHSNVGSLRFLVDPVVDGEPTDVTEQKYAYKADLRILDGVWYLRDDDDPLNIGTPIWSDHPGTFSTAHPEGLAANLTGQANVGTDRGWTSPPNGYSYYRFGPTGNLLPRTSSQARSTISYGSLSFINNGNRATTNARWAPAAWFDNASASNKWGNCGGGGNQSAGDTGLSAFWGTRREDYYGMINRWRRLSDEVGDDSATSMSKCDSLLLLNASRAGFIEHHRQGGGALPQTASRGQILPINFDVEAFGQAMNNFSAGELGTIFGGAREFNGVVWIGNTWPGSLDGILAGTAPNLVPMDAQGTAATNLAAGGQMIGPTWVATTYPRTGTGFSGAPNSNFSVASNQELPHPFCTDDPLLTGAVMARFGSSSNQAFTVPPCSEYVDARGGHANAVRVMNAQIIDPVAFPKGLSIVTNLPMYALGDLNIASTPGSSTNWLPFMLGGDSIHHLSNAWQDSHASWETFRGINSGTSRRRSVAPTTYNYAAMAGWTPSFNGSRGTVFHNFNGYNEDWRNNTNSTQQPQFINASNVIGWASVYMTNSRSSGPPQYVPPVRNWSFDTNFAIFSNQPPGAPVFDVAAIKRFDRN